MKSGEALSRVRSADTTDSLDTVGCSTRHCSDLTIRTAACFLRSTQPSQTSAVPMSFSLSPINIADLAGCAKVYRLAFNHEDDLARLVFPARLRRPDVSLDDRIRWSAANFETQMQASPARFFGHKATLNETGEVIGFTHWMAPDDGKESKTNGARCAPGLADEQFDLVTSEFDANGMNRFQALKGDTLERHVDSPVWSDRAPSPLSQYAWLISASHRYLNRCATLPRYERRGIAMMLVKAGLQQVEQTETIHPSVIIASRKSIVLYERCGFVKVAQMELVEPIDEFGDARETVYSWTLMTREVGRRLL